MDKIVLLVKAAFHQVNVKLETAAHTHSIKLLIVHLKVHKEFQQLDKTALDSVNKDHLNKVDNKDPLLKVDNKDPLLKVDNQDKTALVANNNFLLALINSECAHQMLMDSLTQHHISIEPQDKESI